MRKGYNPNKDKSIAPINFFHQIIIPVYIPSLSDDYFKDSFTILKMCMESLYKTCHKKTFFSIVNNGCCDEVAAYLDELFNNGTIHELIHANNIGKLNAIIKGLVGHKFQFVTISDADVLFINNWQEETYKVFEKFVKAGSVSPTPNSKMLRYLTSNILWDNFFSKTVKFTTVKNPNAMKSFAKSIGNELFFNDAHLDKYLTIGDENFRAVIGSGHFVATYRGCIFDKLDSTVFSTKMGDELMFLLDKPVVDNGKWRLATENNFAFHMGNVVEDWMIEELKNVRYQNTLIDKIELKEFKSNRFENWFKNRFFSKFIFQNLVWKKFIEYKGLTKEEAIKY